MYERIAQTRPRIRRDVLFTGTPEGVLFHNAEGGFTLTSKSAYRFASLLVPYLDGRHQVAEICAPLGPNQRTMVVELVNALYERNLARDVPVETGPGHDLPAEVARRFAAQLAYIEHYQDTPAARFRRFRDTTVAVLGSGPVARSCVRSLLRNGAARVAAQPADDRGEPRLDEIVAEARELTGDGCPAEIVPIESTLLSWSDLAPYDVVAVVADEGPPGQTLGLLAAGVPVGRTLVPVWSFGERAIVGPTSTTDSRGCWVCAALRLGANGDRAAAADLWSGSGLPVVTPVPPRRPVGPVAAMLGNLVGYEIFRITTGVLPAETDGKIIIQNLESVDVLAEELLPHPGCARCSALGPEPGERRPARAASGSATLGTEVAGGDTAQVTGGDTVPGVPNGLVDLDAEVAGGDPAEAADPQAEADAILAELDARMVLVGRHAGVFTGFDDDGWTQTPLKVSTVEFSLGHGPRRRIAAFDVHHVAGARRRALHVAAEAYAAWAPPRPDGPVPADLPRVLPAALSIASGVVAEGSVRYRPATSLLTGERWQVPAGAVQPLGPDNRDRTFLTGSGGNGAGGSLAAATWRGLRSALCHLALLAAIRGLTPARRVAPETVCGSPELEFLVKSADNLGVGLELLDLTPTGPAGTQVLLARHVDRYSGVSGWRAAAHTSWNRAAVAVVRDLLGAVQLGRQLPDGTPVDAGDPLVADFDPDTLEATEVVAARVDVRHGWPELSTALRASGYDPLVVPTTPVDLRIGGIVTARVLLARRDER
ncbi:TOMM precursor leader peptide-binding protein [Plantactinospora mayteni]|nr:TOMM precursor leader peptide-binding protein [Plantactinospora mayteni]